MQFPFVNAKEQERSEEERKTLFIIIISAAALCSRIVISRRFTLSRDRSLSRANGIMGVWLRKLFSHRSSTFCGKIAWEHLTDFRRSMMMILRLPTLKKQQNLPDSAKPTLGRRQSRCFLSFTIDEWLEACLRNARHLSAVFRLRRRPHQLRSGSISRADNSLFPATRVRFFRWTTTLFVGEISSRGH